MALPTLTKTWRFLVNYPLATTGVAATDFRQNLLFAKKVLANADTFTWTDSNGVNASAPPNWTVPRSSNSVSATSSDLWSANTDLVPAAANTAHSWIVLANSAIGANFQIVIDYCNSTAYRNWLSGVAGASPSASNGYGGIFVTQQGGFTVGTIQNRPVDAANEVQIFNRRIGNGTTQNWIGLATDTAFNSRVHVMRSTDGLCNRIVYYVNGYVTAYFQLDVPVNYAVIPGPPSYNWNGDNMPWFGSWTSSLDAANRTYDVLDASNNYAKWLFDYNHNTRLGNNATPGGNLETGLYVSSEALGQASATPLYLSIGVNAVNEVTNEYPLCPLGLVSRTANRRGHVGTIPDLYVVPTALADGDTFPNDATRQFVVMGDFAFPWNGTVLQTTTP